MLARAIRSALPVAAEAARTVARSTMPHARRAGAAAGLASKAGAVALRAKPRKDFVYYPDEAVKMVKLAATAKFDESVDIAIQMGLDPRKPGQNMRGVAQLPHGTGKTARVAVFARGDKAEEARAAGADVVGAEDLVELVQSGALAADKVIATPDTMPLVGRVGRILGPRGLMPNPKLGTVTMDVGKAVSDAKMGQVGFRVDKTAIIHAPIGRVSFSDEALLANLRALVLALNSHKPEGYKGDLFRTATLSSTMGPGVHIDAATLDPAKARFGATSAQGRDASGNVGAAVAVDASAVLRSYRRGDGARA